METNWRIKRYEPSDSALWDAMATDSRCATFQHLRGYMDYHSDRFRDCSLMAYHKGRLTALLPANVTADGELVSHQGLTYGGWLLPMGKVDGNQMMQLWDALLEWCRANDIVAIHYKPLPYIYALRPSQEDLYALWRHGATLEESNLSSAIDMRAVGGFDTMRRRHLRAAIRQGVIARQSDDFAAYWQILDGCLSERYSAQPVHTLDEIKLLHSRFPENIKLFMAYHDEEPIGGVCIYETPMVAHCQYIATNAAGRDLHALAVIFDYLISKIYTDKPYFDFGTSNEDHGHLLNAGLLANKFGYGGSGVAYQKFVIKL